MPRNILAKPYKSSRGTPSTGAERERGRTSTPPGALRFAAAYRPIYGGVLATPDQEEAVKMYDERWLARERARLELDVAQTNLEACVEAALRERVLPALRDRAAPLQVGVVTARGVELRGPATATDAHARYALLLVDDGWQLVREDVSTGRAEEITLAAMLSTFGRHTLDVLSAAVAPSSSVAGHRRGDPQPPASGTVRVAARVGVDDAVDDEAAARDVRLRTRAG